LTNHIIELPDGFNGHTVKCYSEPIQSNGESAKLKIAEPGKEYMFMWVSWNTRLAGNRRKNALRNKFTFPIKGAQNTDEPITCPDCLSIIRYCKELKLEE